MGLENNFSCSENLSLPKDVDLLVIPEGILKHQRDIILGTREDLGGLLNQVKENYIRSTVSINSGNEILDKYIVDEIIQSIFSLGISGDTTLNLDNFYIDETIHAALERLQTNNQDEYLKLKQYGGEITVGNSTRKIQDYFPENIGEIDNLIDFLKSYGLPESSREICMSILLTRGLFAESISDDDLRTMFSNLVVFIEFIVKVESSGGKNIQNDQGSSAKGPFQYIDGFIDGQPTLVPSRDNKGNIIKDESGNIVMRRAFDRSMQVFSPFDTALNRVQNFYNNMHREYIPDWIDINWARQDDISPLDLSWEQSINLWLIDSFTRGNGSTDYLRRVIVNGDSQAMKDFYYKIHHTRPSQSVIDNVNRHFYPHANRLQVIQKMIYTTIRPQKRP